MGGNRNQPVVSRLKNKRPNTNTLVNDVGCVGNGLNYQVGSLPKEMSKCTCLEELYVQDNNLWGKIPDSFRALRELRYLYLYRVSQFKRRRWRRSTFTSFTAPCCCFRPACIQYLRKRISTVRHYCGWAELEMFAVGRTSLLAASVTNKVPCSIAPR